MSEKTQAFQDTVMSLLASPAVLQIVSNIVTPRVSEAIPRMVNSAAGQRTMSRQQRDIFTSEKNRQDATSSVVGDFMRFAMSNPKVIEAVVGIVSNMGVASAAKTSTLRGGKQSTTPTALFSDTFSSTIVNTITKLLSDFFGNRLLCLLGNFAKQFLVRAADTALSGILCGSDCDCCNCGYGLTGNCGCYHKPRNCSSCKMSCADRCAALRYGYCGSVGGSWRPGCCASFCGGDCDECVRCCEPACCRDCCCGGGGCGRGCNGGGCGCNGGGCGCCGAFGCGPSGGGGCGSPCECTIFNRQYCGGNGCDGYSPIPTQGGCCGGFGIAQPFSGCPIGVPACAGAHCCAPCGC